MPILIPKTSDDNTSNENSINEDKTWQTDPSIKDPKNINKQLLLHKVVISTALTAFSKDRAAFQILSKISKKKLDKLISNSKISLVISEDKNLKNLIQ